MLFIDTRTLLCPYVFDYVSFSMCLYLWLVVARVFFHVPMLFLYLAFWVLCQHKGLNNNNNNNTCRL
jgi:hypothetical protein